jgi:hypothetical protein
MSRRIAYTFDKLADLTTTELNAIRDELRNAYGELLLKRQVLIGNILSLQSLVEKEKQDAKAKNNEQAS